MNTTDTLTNAPPLDLHAHGEIVDIGGGDPVDAMVGRSGYLANVKVDDCLPPTGRGPRDEAVFDRIYFPADGKEQVLVDTLSGGSAAEVASEEASKEVARKREWAEANGVKYIVYIDPTLSDFS
jgi:hypothetical protein